MRIVGVAVGLTEAVVGINEAVVETIGTAVGPMKE